MYSDFTTISETQLAQVMKLTPQEVKIELEQLHKLQLMVYEPKNESPKLTFILPRQDADRLPVDRVEFDRRRDLHFSKMEAMINYVEQDHRCRMQLIQEYFDEVSNSIIVYLTYTGIGSKQVIKLRIFSPPTL